MTFTDVMNRYSIPYKVTGHHHCRQGWVQLDCPFCKERDKFHLGYNLQYKYCNCWQCGSHTVHAVFALLLPLTYQQVKRLVRDLDGETSKYQEPSERAHGKVIIPPNVGPLLPIHKAYLKDRGFDVGELQRLWKIKAYAHTGQLNWRIFIPIELHGKTVSWTTRAISKRARPKYLSATPHEEVMLHKTLLYGEDYARDSIIICEGPTDVWRVGTGAVCTFGLTFLVAQIVRMKNYRKRIICFDNEQEAQRRARTLQNMLAIYDGETINVRLDSEDPGSATIIEVQRLRKLAELDT